MLSSFCFVCSNSVISDVTSHGGRCTKKWKIIDLSHESWNATITYIYIYTYVASSSVRLVNIANERREQWLNDDWRGCTNHGVGRTEGKGHAPRAAGQPDQVTIDSNISSQKLGIFAMVCVIWWMIFSLNSVYPWAWRADTSFCLESLWFVYNEIL